MMLERMSEHMDLPTQLNRAIEYIKAHIDDDLALDDVSTVANYSLGVPSIVRRDSFHSGV